MKTKFVLIERGEGFKNTYTTERVAIDALKRGSIQSYRPVTLKEIKSLRANEYREDHYFRHIEEDEFYNKYNNLKTKATVIYATGTVFGVRLHDAEEIGLREIYACNIKETKTWYSETACVFYTEGQVVDVEIKVFSNFKLFICGLTPGHFDAEKWNSLNQSKLAFKCDENGRAINGLFFYGR